MFYYSTYAKQYITQQFWSVLFLKQFILSKGKKERAFKTTTQKYIYMCLEIQVLLDLDLGD